ncbi:glycosyltransferase family 4 protein [Dyadobacter sandarakinus]|uniref:Glycosyltransferase family 4 protein n=1 Tax=Dyadobacter sandarakinus TaxID=2747268 RepID=A0ABX7I4D0_9BACT|nr:glycosyltransferase family 4 protein [Dyadobacter sandarakinus]QRQ99900.1 glycosyltransferase family 4 protein [Dyadobacter sandarakinus]
MEILFVSHKYPPAIGGMEKQSYELITGMQRHARVHTIVYDGSGSRLLFFLSLQKRILCMCRQHPGISVIHFNDALIAAMCLWHKGYGHLARTVTLHGLDVVFPLGLYQQYILPRFNRFDLLIAVSRATATTCAERGLMPGKLMVIHNGVDQQQQAQVTRREAARYIEAKYGLDLAGRQVLLSVGRPVRRKGFSWFIREVLPMLGDNALYLMAGPYRSKRTWGNRLFSLLPAGFRQLTELFFGLPSDENKIRELAKRTENKNRYQHLGKVPAEDLSMLLSAADAFVMPNIAVKGDMEGFGLVCLEASLHGTPVLAAELDGITDAVHHGRNGFLLPAGDAGAWVLALSELNLNQSADPISSDMAQHYTRTHFSWKRMVGGYYKAFQEVIIKKN